MALPGWLGKIIFGFAGSLIERILGIFKRKKELKDAEAQGEAVGKAEGISEARNEDYKAEVERIKEEQHPVTAETLNEQKKRRDEELQ